MNLDLSLSIFDLHEMVSGKGGSRRRVQIFLLQAEYGLSQLELD